MAKFKLGDKVEILSSLHQSVNNRGDVGIITEVDDDDPAFAYRVHVEGKDNWGNWQLQKELKLYSHN